ncbi:hypothetical protein Lnau_1095 [Legionella nautarum]|uniref:Uncharacterized protein n=1 Tax=Legionella nautarum TaxID=45070 RepID=A0A0W0WV03_9GAMM|nr:hypothetical protein [Legionella nautarum]KTD36111.1 hypothetical protein Lnau_1095 [Legionella nautarum]
MKYALVATPGYLLCINLETKEVTPIENHRREYYGISWFPGQKELILSHSNLDNNSLIDIHGYSQSEVGYVSEGTQVSQQFLSQPHQLLCAPDKRIICTNTGRNAISVIDLEKPGLYHEARVSSARWDRLSLTEYSGDHINSVFLKDDQLFVICHRFKKGSILATFAYPSLELIDVKNLYEKTGLHNIWVTDEGQQISCDSENGSIIDLLSGQILWQSEVNIMTRGIAANSEYLLVGESKITGRTSRMASLSGLWILERESWKTVDYFCLGPFGCVHEVRLLDVPDEAHHGHIYYGLESLLQKNMYRDIERQSIIGTSSEVYKFWKNYRLLYGAPEILPDSSKKVDDAELCLAITKNPSESSNSSFAFDYFLSTDTKESHVSAVLGYHGNARDTHMHAILLQRTEDIAWLSIWMNDGNSWSLIPGISISGLPISGIMKINIEENNIQVLINQKEILNLSPESINCPNYQRGFGIRWLGAAVRPCP